MSLALAGCDRQGAGAPQGDAANQANAAAAPAARYPTGRLDRSHAGGRAGTIFQDPQAARQPARSAARAVNICELCGP